MDPNVVSQDAFNNLQAVAAHGDLNPVQKTQFEASSKYYGGQGGGGGGATMPSSPTPPDLQAIYDTHYTNNPDVQATNKSITDLTGQITARQQARDAAIKDVNDNPFYSEARRLGEQAKVDASYQND